MARISILIRYNVGMQQFSLKLMLVSTTIVALGVWIYSTIASQFTPFVFNLAHSRVKLFLTPGRYGFDVPPWAIIPLWFVAGILVGAGVMMLIKRPTMGAVIGTLIQGLVLAYSYLRYH